MSKPIDDKSLFRFSEAQHRSSAETHQVFNQPTPLENYNAFLSDQVLQDWVTCFKGDWANDKLSEYGAKVGGDLLSAGFAANKYKPEFHSHDRFGNRVDLVEYHPAYHELMKAGIEAGHHSIAWRQNRVGAHVARAALTYLHSQADPGTGCPLTMTFASVPALKHQPDVAQDWIPKITADVYDPRNVPFYEKDGLTIGMAMTEKQGGSDVRANTTRAYPVGDTGPGREYEIVGHKWFCSAPMCDGFLVLAHTDNGLSCFLLPRWRPDGTKNQMYIQRLKNKMSNVSNASSEVEYRGALAWMIGEEGRGVRTIIEMVAMTRFDCMVGSSSIMGLASQQALHHTSGREVFGKNLHQQPLMQNVLADLAIESEAALAISMRMAHALDNSDRREEVLFARIGAAIGKYWICKRAAQHAYESMESIGAVGLIEDNVLARLYREAPVNSIWEGSGNVQCLDVLRAMQKEPDAVDVFLQQLSQAKGSDKDLDHHLSQLTDDLTDVSTLEYRARSVVEKVALAWQATTLLTHGNPVVAEAFIQSRIRGNGGYQYGTLPSGIQCEAIIERAKPQINKS